MRTVTFQIVDEDGEDQEVELPARRVVCHRCDGDGTHTNPNVDGHGITADEWYGPDWDDESRDAYLHGVYDVTCEVCRGAKVLDEVDVAACKRGTPEVQAAYKAWRRHERDLANMRAEEAAERRAGC